MNASKRPLPFVLAATDHGSLIVNRNDYRMLDKRRGYGVGFQLLNSGRFDPQEIAFVLALLRRKRRHAGDGVVALDCGANIGVHTVEWAREMHGWGSVYAFEAQEKIYYALAGNVVINNCLNVTARHCAVGSRCGTLEVPQPDYCRPASFGSLELVQREKTEFIGQPVDYSVTQPVALLSIDSLALPRIDLIKIDVEGMEEDVLAGAEDSLQRQRPVLLVEQIKSDAAALKSRLLRHGYRTFNMDINLLAVHEADPLLANISTGDGSLKLR